VLVHWECVHVDPGGQVVQEAPQASTSLVVSTHVVPQSEKPVLQVKLQVAPEQIVVAFPDASHAAHAPPQQIPTAHATPFATSPVATQVACPLLHEIAPVRQTFPSRAHAAPATHAVQVPLKQTSPVPHAFPFTTLPTASHVAETDVQEVTPV
jgi:hypothetical protein